MEQKTPDSLAAEAIYKCWKELRGFLIFIIVAAAGLQIVNYAREAKAVSDAKEAIERTKMQHF